MKNWYAIAIIRMISAIGSFVSGSTILLFLVEQGRQNEAPLNSAATVLGALFATRILMPRLLKESTRKILITVELTGLLITMSLPLLLWFGVLTNIPGNLFLLFSFLTSAICVIGTSVSLSSYVSQFKNPNAMNWDSTLQILGRVLAPGIAASLLTSTKGNMSAVLLIDSLSYALSAAAFGFLLGKDKKEDIPVATSTSSSLSSIFLSRPLFWGTVAFVTFGAGAYNSGALIILKERGFDLSRIAVFMMVQNSAMVAASLLGAKFGLIKRNWASVLAATGLAVFGWQDPSFFVACAGTIVMATGMMPLLQSLRMQVSDETSSQEQVRMEQSFFSLVSSISGICGIIFFQTFAQFFNWHWATLIGGLFLLGPVLLPLKKYFTIPTLEESNEHR